MTVKNVIIEGYSLPVSNLEKILWPQDGYTKGELIYYYMEVAPYILKHLKNRPLVFTRYPDGITGKAFYQKNAPLHLPDWINTYSSYSSKFKRTINFILVDNAAALAWLANQACIEIHPWLSRQPSIDTPDYVVFDLDPSPENDFDQVIQVAQFLKELFNQIQLRTYLKTSGADGLHIYLPVKNDYSYKQIRKFAQHIAAITVQALPLISTIERSIAKRGPKIYIDYLQNVKGKTLCSPYCIRPRAGAPISCPISWDELLFINPREFNISSILKRLNYTGDLFAQVLTDQQSLEPAARQLGLNISK